MATHETPLDIDPQYCAACYQAFDPRDTDFDYCKKCEAEHEAWLEQQACLAANEAANNDE